MPKETLLTDVECFPNYFMVGFKHHVTRKYHALEMIEGGPALDTATLRRLLLQYRHVTFNGLNYDMVMLMLAMKGKTCRELKAASDYIIQQRMRGWQSEKHFDAPVWKTIDHIDVQEVAPGVMISLKKYGARMHAKHVQELPYPHDSIITPEMRPVVVRYNENDLDTTGQLLDKLTKGKDDVIGIRELIGADIEQDLRSKSDAQVAEALIRAKVSKLKGEQVYKADIPAGTTYRYQAPAFLKFQTPQLQEVFESIVAADFVVGASGKVLMPKALEGRKVKLGTNTFKMGVGGLHSTEQSACHVRRPGKILRDVDAVSFYPKLIIECGFYPPNMGEAFATVYRDLYERRIAAKKAGHKTTMQTLKIALNGSFGKLGSPYSVLYAPDLLIQVTVTGQLSLLMLIERFEAAGITVVSANTDGIVVHYDEALEPMQRAIVSQWGREVGLDTEETNYRALFSRDVNSYLAIKDEGGTKTKGEFADTGLMKTPNKLICTEAAAAFLEHGTPIGQTILACRDIRKFIVARESTSGAIYGGETVTVAEETEDGEPAVKSIEGGEFLGKTCRWYYGRGETRCIRSMKPNKKGNFNKVASSDGARIVMELPDDFPTDIDWDRYLQEANDILRDVGAIHG